MYSGPFIIRHHSCYGDSAGGGGGGCWINFCWNDNVHEKDILVLYEVNCSLHDHHMHTACARSTIDCFVFFTL